MKIRNISRRLFLNKKTIADLNGGQMEHLKAGGPPDPHPTCRDTDARSNCPTGITCESACSLGGNCC